MLWFVRHRFAYVDHNVEPSRRLAATLAQEKWRRIVYQFTHDGVKIQHKLPSFFLNYWNPVFVGRFLVEGEKHYLVGYFRAPWFIFIANLAAMILTAYRLLSISLMSSAPGAHVDSEIYSPLRWAFFFCALVLLMALGWLLGVPYSHRIVAAIRESTTITAIPASDIDARAIGKRVLGT